MDLLTIILFASVALFFAVRLYTVLGRKTGHEPSAEPKSEAAEPAPAANNRPHLRAAFTGPAAAGMEAIRAADGVFEPETFLAGARQAYELIVTAFADGDRDALKGLLTDRLYAKWDQAIADREAAGRKQISDLVSLEGAEIDAAELIDGAARVTVFFKADLASAVVGPDDEPVEGDAAQIRRVNELWTFERLVESSDPNWRLAKVRKG
jgi:predicted lipid-binding transport protein (Tim44 family)